MESNCYQAILLARSQLRCFFARKRTNLPSVPVRNPKKNTLRQIGLRVEPKLHKKLKVLALKRDLTFNALCREALERCAEARQ